MYPEFFKYYIKRNTPTLYILKNFSQKYYFTYAFSRCFRAENSFLSEVCDYNMAENFEWIVYSYTRMRNSFPHSLTSVLIQTLLLHLDATLTWRDSNS